MCLSCGCGNPNDDHGDSRNITLTDLNQAAEAAGTTRDRVLQNIMQGSQQGSSDNEQQQQPEQQPVGVNTQSQAQQNQTAQATAQPGTLPGQQGQESGTAWRQDREQLDYQPPRGQDQPQ